MRRALVFLGLIVLASCSQLTRLSARFIDGRIAFLALDGRKVECVEALSVVDVASREVMWEFGSYGTCQGSLPIRYGQAVPNLQQAAKPLRDGRRYEVGGSASGGNSLDGRFVLSRADAWRLTDMEWDPALDEVLTNMVEGLNDTANNSQ